MNHQIPNNPLPVIIVHWNRPEECLKAVAVFQRQELAVSVRIVDNASDPESLQQLLRQLPRDVETIRVASNRGWGGGLNVGLQQWLENEVSEFCIVAAHDALPEPECLSMLVKAMESDPRSGVLCPQYPTNDIGFFSPIRGPRVLGSMGGPKGSVTDVGFCHGTLMLFRRSCLRQIGLFDERFFAYGDEMEISLRAKKRGWNIGIVWGAVVVNPGTWTLRPVVAYLNSRNSLLLAKEYGGSISAVLRALLLIGNSVRMLLSFRQQQAGLCFPKARFRAVVDFLRGKFGKPPVLN